MAEPGHTALLEALLEDFPDLRYGYSPSVSAEDDRRQPMRRLASTVNELVAKEPESAGVRRAFGWAQRLAGESATVSSAASFHEHLSPLPLAFRG